MPCAATGDLTEERNDCSLPMVPSLKDVTMPSKSPCTPPVPTVADPPPSPSTNPPPPLPSPSSPMGGSSYLSISGHRGICLLLLPAFGCAPPRGFILSRPAAAPAAAQPQPRIPLVLSTDVEVAQVREDLLPDPARGFFQEGEVGHGGESRPALPIVFDSRGLRGTASSTAPLTRDLSPIRP